MPVDRTPTVILSITPEGQPGVFVCDTCYSDRFVRRPSPAQPLFVCVECDEVYYGDIPLGEVLVVHGADIDPATESVQSLMTAAELNLERLRQVAWHTPTAEDAERLRTAPRSTYLALGPAARTHDLRPGETTSFGTGEVPLSET